MTVQELIAKLSKCPPDYEVQTILSELPSPNAAKEKRLEYFENVKAMSAYLNEAQADEGEETVFLYGAAAPESCFPQFSEDDEDEED